MVFFLTVKNQNLCNYNYFYTVPLGNWGTGIDCYSALPFRSEPKQMEIDDEFNCFGARSEKKASSFQACLASIFQGHSVCGVWCCWSSQFLFPSKDWEREAAWHQGPCLCGSLDLTNWQPLRRGPSGLHCKCLCRCIWHLLLNSLWHFSLIVQGNQEKKILWNAMKAFQT